MNNRKCKYCKIAFKATALRFVEKSEYYVCKKCDKVNDESQQKFLNQELEKSKVGLQYNETRAFEIICEHMKIEYKFEEFDEEKQLNIYQVKIPLGKSGILFDIGKLIQSKTKN
jgi:hypothetical protein